MCVYIFTDNIIITPATHADDFQNQSLLFLSFQACTLCMYICLCQMISQTDHCLLFWSFQVRSVYSFADNIIIPVTHADDFQN